MLRGQLRTQPANPQQPAGRRSRTADELGSPEMEWPESRDGRPRPADGLPLSAKGSQLITDGSPLGEIDPPPGIID